jgi:hypothetical protein
MSLIVISYCLKSLKISYDNAYRETVCCLLVLNSVTSTPQWIRKPQSRYIHTYTQVRVFAC